jgi:hypothetical protein
MIKCYFIDVKNISSDLPRSSFSELDLDRLADSILATDGLLRPLILKASGVEKYTVIEGHREYYAAVKAKEKNLNKAEMVNAFAIESKNQKSAIEQLKLLTAQQPSPQTSSTIDPAIDRQKSAKPNPSSNIEQLLPTLLGAVSQQVQPIIDQLLPTLLAVISEQIQPIVEQLAEHQQILDLLMSERQSATNRQAPQPPESIDIQIPVTTVVEPPKQPDIIAPPPIKSKKNLDIQIPVTTVVEPPKQPDVIVPPSITKKKTISKAKDSSSSPIPEPVNPPKQTVQKEVASPKTTKSTTTKDKKTANLLESIDSTKATNTLDLINTLSLEQLILKMERSALPKPIVKLATHIITNRDTQPMRKFDSWETIAFMKIKGLTDTNIKKIIDNLR